jgi:hypothetical protein
VVGDFLLGSSLRLLEFPAQPLVLLRQCHDLAVETLQVVGESAEEGADLVVVQATKADVEGLTSYVLRTGPGTR